MMPIRAPRHLAAVALLGALLGAVIVVGVGVAPAIAADDEPVTITLFWGDGCPHCAAERAFLDDLVARYPEVVVDAYEVWYDDANRDRFVEVAAAHGIEPEAVPTTFLGGRHWVGFDERIGAEIEAAVVADLAARSANPSASAPASASAAATPESVELPIVGAIDSEGASLVALTGLIALVDGFNPCSLWVMSILLAMMLHSGSRKRLLAVGVTFLVVAGAAYGLFMLGLFAALDWIGYGPWVRAGIAAVVGILGALAVRDFFAVGGGFSMSIPEPGKRDVTRRSRMLALSDRPLLALVPLTALLAAGVSLLELPCTAGFPVLWNGILADRGVVGLEFAGLLALYLTIFLADELVLFGVALVTMRVAKLQEHHGRALKLVAGSVMLALAATMLVAPDLLQSLGGTLLLFGTALGAAAILLLVTRRRADAVVPPTGSRRHRRSGTAAR